MFNGEVALSTVAGLSGGVGDGLAGEAVTTTYCGFLIFRSFSSFFLK